MIPDPELLRTEFLGVTVRFDEVPLDREDLALFFAQVGDRYGLHRFEYHPEGGVTMAGADGTEFILRPGQMSSCGVTRLGLAEGRERVVGLLAEAAERYRVGSMWIDDTTVVAAWDMQDADAARTLLVEDVVRLDEERLAPLGESGDLSVGLRVWRSMGDGSLDLSLEPMHADTSKIYVRLAYSQPEPVPDAAAVAAVVDRVAEYLQGPVIEFVVSLARR
ncbi:MAG: hypothetical protein AB1416_04760 [Actinomycetota bacterium]